MGERIEAILRIPIFIVSGFILGLWLYVVLFISVVHWSYALIFGKRSYILADFSNTMCTQYYVFFRYITLASNERPFPFTELAKIKPVDFKKPK